MITETESYKGRKFVCDSCGYVVSSDAMSDFDVEDFKFCPCCGTTMVNTGIMRGLDMAIEIVNQLAEEYNQGWIPVTERLPEEDGRYLTTAKFNSGIIESFDLFLNDEVWLLDEDDKEFCGEVIAWQPLPEPYKPEEKPKFSNEEFDAIMDKILDGNQEPKTRIEHIRSMSVEEMADAILERSEISTAIDFCQKFEECWEGVSEDECKKCLIKYLNSPVEQKKTIPTEYFTERFNKVL